MEKRKNNVALRAAIVLCVLALFCAAFVGGTFAKYVTNDTAADNARVANWGITVSLAGSLFGAHYAAGTTDVSIVATASDSVAASDDLANIVAPGTKSDAGFTVKLAGTPEVAYDVTANVNSKDIQDIYLNVGTYGVMVAVYGITADNFGNAGPLYTKNASNEYVLLQNFTDAVGGKFYELHDSVEVTDIYRPLDWTVTATGADTTAIAATKDLVAITQTLVSQLDALEGNANDPLAAQYKLEWQWNFDNGADNAKDTILGNLIAQANGVMGDGEVVIFEAAADSEDVDCYKAPTARADASNLNNYNLNVVFGLGVEVTQIDGVNS